MLRITVHKKLQAVTFQLEGRLTAPWLEELAGCWQRTLSRNGTRTIRVDLTGLTFVDNAGKTCLKAMHRRGAEFIAADCETKSIVDEITSNPVTRNGHSKQKKGNRNKRS
jgi:ABC-type transporter Mla MlaB component